MCHFNIISFAQIIFQHDIFIDWELHIRHPNHTHFQVLPDMPPPHTCDPSLPPKKKMKTPTSPICAPHILKHGQIFNGHSFKRNRVRPPPTTPPEAINCGELHFSNLMKILKTSLQCLPVWAFTLGGGSGEEGVTEVFHDPLSQLWLRSHRYHCKLFLEHQRVPVIQWFIGEGTHMSMWCPWGREHLVTPEWRSQSWWYCSLVWGTLRPFSLLVCKIRRVVRTSICWLWCH